MAQDRDLTWDIAKGIGIILVVYGHVARGVYNAGLPMDEGFYRQVDSIIYSFHMPLFFFISGYFFPASLAKHGSLPLIRGKIATVVYPYVVWSLQQGLVEIGLGRFTNGGVTLAEVLALAWMPRAQFWFLYLLFGAFILAVLLYRRTTPAWSALILGTAAVYYFIGYSPVDWFMLNALPQWFFYFALGAAASHMLPRLQLDRWPWLWFAATLFVVAEWGFHQGLGLTAESHAPLAKLTVACLGIFLVLQLSRHLAKWKWTWLVYLGRHSLEIYLIHILAGSGARILLDKGLGIADPGVHLLLGTLAGVGLPLLFLVVARPWGGAWLFAPAALRRRSI